MAYDNANTYETIELFGLTEKDAQLPIPEDHVLTDHIVRESFEALLGQLRGTGLEAEIEPLAHGHDRETAEKSKVEGVPLIVSGATDWTDVDVIFNTLDKVRERIKQNRNQEIFLCHKGGKHGAEMIAARWARARGVAQARFDPRWSAHGRAAPFKCNDEMLDDKFAATGVVLFGGNGVALNLGQKAEAKGLTVMRVADPAKKTAQD